MLSQIFDQEVEVEGNFIMLKADSDAENQGQTNAVFSEKWEKIEENMEAGMVKAEKFQLEWYLTLYGFDSEDDLKSFLSDKKVIFDAGCGLGYKAAWFAKLAPHATVIGMDFSESALQSAKKYADIDNLYFIQGDIAKTPFKDGIVDYVNCDQVIMHTEYPEKTFAHLSAKTSENGEFACYIYAKKALPRELLDDYFRREVHGITNEQLWEVSEQLTELGKRLSDLKVTFESPDIPLLGIKGGEYDIQRFIYWNFIKCFWNPELGKDISDATNFDWYSPSNARRYTESEFREMISDSNMEDSYFYIQEAAYSGRFIHKK